MIRYLYQIYDIWSSSWRRRGWTTKIDSATRPFLKFDMRHGYFLKLTCDIGAKIISDMRRGYFWLVTGDRAIFLAILTCDMAVFKIRHATSGPPHPEPQEDHRSNLVGCTYGLVETMVRWSHAVGLDANYYFSTSLSDIFIHSVIKWTKLEEVGIKVARDHQILGLNRQDHDGVGSILIRCNSPTLPWHSWRDQRGRHETFWKGKTPLPTLSSHANGGVSYVGYWFVILDRRELTSWRRRELVINIYKTNWEGSTRSSINPSIRPGISLRPGPIGLPEGWYPGWYLTECPLPD